MKLRPYELALDPLPLKTFTFDKANRKLIAEASDFGGAFRLQRLYNDACDVGIAVRSDYTGRMARFQLVRRDERDGEVRAWEFEPVEADRNDLNVLSIVVFND